MKTGPQIAVHKIALSLFLICILTCLGCASGSATQGEKSATIVEAGYTLPLIPIRVSINTQGEVHLGVSAALATLIGTFDIGTSTTIASIQENHSERLLIVIIDSVATVYRLEEGHRFEVSFGDDGTLYRQVSLSGQPDAGNLILELESAKIPPATLTPPPPPPSPTSSTNCSFMNQLIDNGTVIMSIDLPTGSQNWAGAVVHLNQAIDLPSGWIVQEAERADIAGPAKIPNGTTATFWSPLECRPLNGPFVSQESCAFWNTLLVSGNVVHWNYHAEIVSGVNIRLTSSVDVPSGWTIDIGSDRRYGPTTIIAPTLASFWSPVDCRPLSLP